MDEFDAFWNRVIKVSLKPRTALIVVDVQNDFIDGSLSLKNCPAKQDGAEIVPIINYLIDTVPFDAIVYTLDWHPEDHCSFVENVHKHELASNSPVSFYFFSCLHST